MRLLLALAAGALGYFYYLGHNARLKKGLVREDLNRWEGEGGNVPAVATPSPAPTPASSYPSGDDIVRH
ncbi:MAG TPA: hypothetical protein VFP44_06585 [Usitatibacter sp.]|nr:hypothetical protein [Usitatibacter sp.]